MKYDINNGTTTEPGTTIEFPQRAFFADNDPQLPTRGGILNDTDNEVPFLVFAKGQVWPSIFIWSRERVMWRPSMGPERWMLESTLAANSDSWSSIAVLEE